MHIIAANHVLASGSVPFYKSIPFGIGFSLVVGAIIAGGSEAKSKRKGRR